MELDYRQMAFGIGIVLSITGFLKDNSLFYWLGFFLITVGSSKIKGGLQ
jgi:uncharacterized membrane protein